MHLKALYCYECKLCKLKLHKQADALTHLDSDECQKRIFYMCEICGQCLGNTMSFNRHRRQFHGAPGKKRHEELPMSEIYGQKRSTNAFKHAIEHSNYERNKDDKIEQELRESATDTTSIDNICDNLIDPNNFDVDDFFVTPLPSKLARDEYERKPSDVHTPSSFKQTKDSFNEVAQTKVDDYPITPDVQFSPSKILCCKKTHTDDTLKEINTILNYNNMSKHTEHQNGKSAYQSCNTKDIYVEPKIHEEIPVTSFSDLENSSSKIGHTVSNQQKVSENRDKSTFVIKKIPEDKCSEGSLKVQQSSKSCQESFERFLQSKLYRPSKLINTKVTKSVNKAGSEIRTPDLVNFHEESLKQVSTDVAMTTLTINEVIQKEFPSETEELPELHNILAEEVSMKNIRYKTTNFEFKCNYCDANFRSKTALCSHTKHKHKSKQQFKCTKCAKTFQYERSLRDHMTLKHSQLNKTKCHICCKKLLISSYKGHMRIHSNEKRYSCPVCAIKFKHPSSRKNHFVKAHVEGQLEKSEDTDLKSMLETFSEDIYC